MPADTVARPLHHGWPEVEAEVTSCRIVRRSGTYRLDVSVPFYAVCFSYTVDGITYEGVTNSPVEVEPRDKFAIRYNPANPEENNSLESELDRPWFKEYTYLFAALLIGLLVLDLFRRYIFHR